MEYQRELAFRFQLTGGADVGAVQQALMALRTDPSCGTADGIYGNATKLAVMGFQRTHGLDVDGIVGRHTWSALFAGVVDKNPRGEVLARAAQSLPPKDFPLTQAQALRVHRWMTSNFAGQVEQAIQGTPLDSALVSAIACKETAPVWIRWIEELLPPELLARCVFDASGDFPGTTRRAFPVNTAAFRARFGDELTDDLIAEANATRRLRGWGDQQWIYKGYGIFQYDLQHIEADPDFFKNKLWRNFDACLDRFMREMKAKLAAANGDLRDAVRRYNGSGPAAEQYRDQVLAMHDWLLPGDRPSTA